MEKALIAVGAPSHVREAAVSTVLRVYEAFNPEKIILVVSPFKEALEAAEEAGEWLSKAFGGGAVEIERLEGGVERYADEVVKLVGDSDLVVPTAGSLALASMLSYEAAKQGKPITHVYFPFGHWTGLHYPFVPRYLQRIVVVPRIDGIESVKAKLRVDSLEPPSHWPRIRREIAKLALRMNEKLYDPCVVNLKDSTKHRPPNLKLEFRQEVDGESVVVKARLHMNDFEVTEIILKKAKRQKDSTITAPRQVIMLGVVEVEDGVRGNIKGVIIELAKRLREDDDRDPESLSQLASWAGFERLNLPCSKEKVIIDTNLLYMGVHNTAVELGHRLVVPYCAIVEVLRKVSEAKKPIDRLLSLATFEALEVCRAHGSTMPTSPYRCDVTIPTADPMLLENSCLATLDKAAARLWRNTAASRLATIHEPAVEVEGYTPNLHYAILQLTALLKIYSEDIGLGKEGG